MKIIRTLPGIRFGCKGQDWSQMNNYSNAGFWFTSYTDYIKSK